MSLTATALDESRARLRPSTTRLTRPDGSVVLERAGQQVQQTGARTAGYVVDTQPDIQLAAVLPWLYLGSQDVAADSVLMAQYNITRVLNVGTGIRIDREAGGVLERRVEMLDTPEYDLRAGLAECEEQLVQWREEGCSVLVHCNAGVSRAPTVIIAFLITQMGLSCQEALDKVKAVRSCIKPNPGFLQFLQTKIS